MINTYPSIWNEDLYGLDHSIIQHLRKEGFIFVRSLIYEVFCMLEIDDLIIGISKHQDKFLLSAKHRVKNEFKFKIVMTNDTFEPCYGSFLDFLFQYLQEN